MESGLKPALTLEQKELVLQKRLQDKKITEEQVTAINAALDALKIGTTHLIDHLVEGYEHLAADMGETLGNVGADVSTTFNQVQAQASLLFSSAAVAANTGTESVDAKPTEDVDAAKLEAATPTAKLTA